MTQTTLELNPPASQKTGSTSIYYRLTNEEWLRAIRELRPAERDVLYYIRTLDPFGSKELELGVRELAEVLNCNPGTVSRALKVLNQKGYIELDLVTIRVRIKNCNEVLSTDNTVAPRQHPRSVDNTPDPETTPAICRQHLRSPEPALSNDPQNAECTNNNLFNFGEQQNSPELVENPRKQPEQVGIGTGDSELLSGLIGAIEDAEIPINKTIRREVLWTIQQYGEEAAKIVRNALSAIAEQQRQNKVRNPGGMLMRALRSGFTSNEEKQRSRQSRQQSESVSQEPKPIKPKLPDVSLLESAVDNAFFSGDRSFMLAKLQQLWIDGWCDIARELCQLRRDWGIKIGADGPQWKEE
jgi:hypothetical protein